MKINSERIRLVELRYFDKDHNGVELGSPLSYAMLYEVEEENVPVFNGTRYVNMFGLNDFDLVLRRSKFYSCCDSAGNDYGTKMELVAGEAKTGPCWVLTDVDFSEVFGPEVSYEALQTYILKSDKYFMDRESIAKERLLNFRNPVKMLRVMDRDKKDAARLNEYFAERGIQKVKKG